MSELRARPSENRLLLGITAFMAVIFLVEAILSQAWADPRLWVRLSFAALVLGPIVLPWIYVRTAVIWWDRDEIGYRWLFRSVRVERHLVRGILAGMGRIAFAGDHRTLMTAGRFMSDAKLQSLARELGLEVRGIGRYLGPLET